MCYCAILRGMTCANCWSRKRAAICEEVRQQAVMHHEQAREVLPEGMISVTLAGKTIVIPAY